METIHSHLRPIVQAGRALHGDRLATNHQSNDRAMVYPCTKIKSMQDPIQVMHILSIASPRIVFV